MKVNMLKILGLVLFSSFVGIMANPEILTASDSVAITGIDRNKVVETVILPETTEVKTPAAGVMAGVAKSVSENKTEVAKTTVAAKTTASAKTTITAKTTVAEAANSTAKIAQKAETPVAPASNVKFAWGTQEMFRASSTSVNAGDKAARYGKLVWGHNYTSFGNITSLKIDDRFTITENGKTITYKVVANPLDGKAGVALDLNNSVLSYNGKTIGMNAMIDLGFGGHSLVLMTCYGAGRYVVVADAI